MTEVDSNSAEQVQMPSSPLANEQDTNTAANSDVEQMSYEAAREELISVVKRLEGAQIPLDQTLKLWERGEALVKHCQNFLRAASDRIEAAAAKEE